MRYRPLYWTSLMFLSGIIFSHRMAHFAGGRWLWLIFLIILVLVILSILRSPRVLLPLIGYFACFFTFGFFYYSWHEEHNHSSINNTAQSVIVVGILEESPDIDGDIVRFRIMTESVNHQPVRERLECRVILRGQDQQREAEKWKRGSRLKFPASLDFPSSARNPGGFDYGSYLLYKKVHWIAQVSSFSDLAISPPDSFQLGTATESVQRMLSATLDRLFTAPAAGVMKGMLLGLRSDISQEVLDEYSKLGFSHVLAISGLHMTVIIGAIWHLLRNAGMTKELSIWITMAIIPCYVLLTGAGPSAMRSAIMAMIGLLGAYLQRKNDGLNLWGAALWAMLLYDPFFIRDVGFQLSFAVTWGLIALTPGIQPSFRFSSPFLSSLFAVTLSAQLISFPLTIYYFHQYNILSFAVNLLFVPLFSLIVIPVGFIAMLGGLIHPALSFLPGQFISLLVEGSNAAFGWLTDLKWFHVHFTKPSLWKMGIYYIVLLGGLWIIKERKLLWVLFSWTAAFLLFVPGTDGEKLTVTFLDVGQGDAAVVEMPDGKVYLIDGGGSFAYGSQAAWKKRRDPFDPGKRIIIPFLKARGIQEIYAVIMTHGDLDHIGGMESVIEEFPVKHAFYNGAKPGSEQEYALLERMMKKGIPIHLAKAGIEWKDQENIGWKVVHPGIGQVHSDNDGSIVLLLEAYGFRLLFPGDLERGGEAVLMQKQLPRLDVLKVGHHGSRTSTSKEWAAMLRPRISVISAGQRNRFGHPHKETLATLREIGSQIYRTDEQGAIIIEIVRNRLTVKPFLQPGEDFRRQ